MRRVTGIDVCPAQLRITGLPLAVIDDTVRISVDGPALATNVRTGIDAPREVAASEETSEVREAKRLAAQAQADLARLQAALARLSSSSILAADPSDEPPAPWAAIVGARRATLALRTERELTLREQIAAARRVSDDTRRKLEAELDRDRRTGTARPAKQHELRKQIEIELAKTGDGRVTIHLEYLVAAARWAPSYVARIDGSRTSFEIRAVVAQASGEDWTGAKLSLSTAEPARFAQLPELAAQRIGRRQDEPVRGGFRAPPVGAEALYVDYLRHASVHTAVAPTTIGAPDMVEYDDDFDGEVATGGRAQSFAEEVWDEESSAAKNAFSTPPQGRPMPMMAPAAPMSHTTMLGGVSKSLAARDETTVMRGRSSAPETKKNADGGGGLAPPLSPAAPQPRLDYPNLMIANPDSPSRGRLVVAPRDAHSEEARIQAGRGQMQVEMLVLPPGCSAAWSHTYDYAYATDGAVDVQADGAWHSIAVTARPASVALHHVAVPREQADVFRIAAIENPFDGPLLPGPIDVYDRGRFLVTSAADYAPPGARVEIGLGVDAAVKIARNTEFREEAAGMLRGSLRLHHAVTIDIDNVSAIPIELEVRERMPVIREGEADIEVTPGRVEPAWEPWKPDAETPAAARLRGGYRWRVTIPAGQKKTLRAAYDIKISSKAELVGGNRRES